MSIATRAALGLVCALGLVGCGRGHTGRTGNLIVNAGADAAAGSTSGAPVVVPSWAVTGRATSMQYGIGVFPDATDPGPTDRGANFFFGGGSATSSLTQTIDVSAYAEGIDAGDTTFDLSAYLGGFLDQSDTCTVTITFFSSAAADVGGAASIGPVSHDDRDDLTALLLRAAHGAVPPSTRTVSVVITMTRLAGGDNDGYADSLSLVLDGV